MRRTISTLLMASVLGGSAVTMAAAAPAMAKCSSGNVCMWSAPGQKGKQTNIKVSDYSQGKNYNINIWLPEASYLGSIYNAWSSRMWANQEANGPTGIERCYAAKGGSGNPDALVGTAVNFILFGATGLTTC
jgi:Peptidase inhibitor family I36